MPLTFNFGPENAPEVLEKRAKTPVTLLAGFLGAGKTTLLKHLLENKDGLRIGVVVNDLASVNIDGQLLRKVGDVELAELQNGCVCCSSADDLFSAVQTIVMGSKDHPFEHILVELSGVGDPQAIRRNWAMATECQLPAALLTSLTRVITVVDASTFAEDWQDTREALPRNGALTSSHESRRRNASSQEMIGQLLAQQVELANVVIINKCDLASEEELKSTLHVLQALNGTAQLYQTDFGRVPTAVLPPVPFGLQILPMGHKEGYSWSQTCREIQIRMPIPQNVKSKDIECSVKKRSLMLGFKSQATVACGTLAGEVACDDTMFEIDGEGSERQVLLCLEKKELGMWNQLWKRSAPACGHQHCNGHCFYGNSVVREADDKVKPKFQSFVFQRRRPFNAKRLHGLLERWQDALSSNEVLDLDGMKFRGVLRSKGFAWCDDAPLHCHRWSQAGRCISCQREDYWWHHLTEEQRRFRCTSPGAEEEFRAVQGKWHTEWGDCRQELVFIGTKMLEQEIVEVLEACLLTAQEFEKFKETTSGMKVQQSDFNLGQFFNQVDEGSESKMSKEVDDADTEFLRSLGVGCNLREAPRFEAVD